MNCEWVKGLWPKGVPYMETPRHTTEWEVKMFQASASPKLKVLQLRVVDRLPDEGREGLGAELVHVLLGCRDLDLRIWVLFPSSKAKEKKAWLGGLGPRVVVVRI